MAGENSVLGSALIIPDSVLNKIKEADEKLQSLQKTAEKTANGILNSFGQVVGGAGKLYEALDAIETKFGSVNAVAGKMPKKIISTDAIIKAAESIDRLSASTKRGFKELFNQEKMIAAAAIIVAEKAAQAEEKVKQAKQATATETAKTTIAEEKAAQTAYKAAALKLKSEQEMAKVEQERQRAQQEALKVDKEVIKTSTAEANKVAESMRAITAKTKAEGEATKQKIAATRVATQEVKLQTQEAKMSIEQARLKKAEAQAHLANAQAVEKEARAQELIARAQQRTNNSNNRTLNYSDFNGVINQYSKANTLEEHKKAIQDLQKARLALVTTDKDYKSNLGKVNAAIIQHSKVLKDAGVNTRNLGEQTSYLSGYLSRLAQRTTIAFSISSVKGFIEQIAQVRGEFEISQRSLESILQNKTKADEIFNKTVELAVKSPFRIKDLISYTRQLSAYRIESDKLYDTTKRLADVSAGLGVDMGRLILAYGQVKAAAYLRGSEVRQFTEAGVNIYGELQSYFKEVKGEAYTTAQIVDMISKRMVSFSDVEAVFQRLTDKGGIFYNMQEVQAETLQGKITNLLDSFDVMLNDIGKSDEGIFKGMISSATVLLRNWQSIAAVVKTLTALLGLLYVQSLRTGVSMSKIFSVSVTQEATKNISLIRLFKNGLKSAADTAVTFGNNLKSAISSNIWLIVISLAISAIYNLYNAWSEYNEKIKEAQTETVKAQGAIGEIAGSYNNLAKAAGDANNKMAGAELEKNINDRRAALQKLIDLAAKDGLEFKIDVQEIKASDLNKTFDTIKKEYSNFIDEIEIIRRNAAQNDNWNTWFTDGLKDNADDYKDAVVDMLSQSSKMEEVVATINANYSEATKYTKQYFDSVRQGQKEGETQIEYYQRMKEAIQGLKETTIDGYKVLPDWLKSQKDNISDIYEGMADVSKAEKDLQDDFIRVYGDLRKKFKGDPIKIKCAIDKIAAENSLDEYSKMAAYRFFGVKININKGEAKEEVSWVDKYLQDFFAKKKYGVNLKVENIDGAAALEKYIQKGDDMANAAKQWADAEKRAFSGVNKNAAFIPVTDDLRSLFRPLDPRIIGKDIISSKLLKEMFAEYKGAATETAKALGVDPFEKENNKKNKETAKEQRDILQEQISLLKEMNEQYNTLRKTKSQAEAVSRTRKMFKEAAQNVGWNADDILPDDKSIAEKIRNLGATAKNVGKRGGYFRMAADIELKIDKKEYDDITDEISRNIDTAFSEFDLYKKLKNLGLSKEQIMQTFGDIAISFDDIKWAMDNEFNKYTEKAYKDKYGKDWEKWAPNVKEQYNKDLFDTENVMKNQSGEDVAKFYIEKTQTLNEKIKQDTLNTFQELVKSYKTQLSEQLQLDAWYYSERAKIQNNERLKSDPELQRQLQENLDKQYKKKTDINTWNSFKESDTYLNIFDNLDNVSTKAIEHMKKKLEALKEQLKSLDPSQLKEVMSFYNKMDEQLNKRNPLKAFIDSFKKIRELRTDGITEDSLVQGITDRDAENAQLNEQISIINRVIELKKDSSKITEDDKQFITDNDEQFSKTINELQGIKQEKQDIISANKKENESANKNLKNYSTARSSLESLTSEWESVKSLGSQAMSSVNTLLEAMGEDTDSTTMAWVKLGESLVELTVQAVLFALQLQLCTVAAQAMGVAMNSALGVIGWVVIALQAVVSVLSTIFGNHDKKLQKQIEDLQEQVRQLERAYNKLKESMDNAFDIQKLREFRSASIATLESQKKAYQAMIDAEKAKKDTDNSKITEWKEKMEDLDETIKEVKEDVTEALGGFGSQANYQSAAEAFAEAWVDAFNEGSDALEALNDKFDEYFDNMLKKQITQRASARFIEPILKAFDDAVALGSEGGNGGMEVTRHELEEIKKLKDKNLSEYNEYLKKMMEILNVKPSGDSNLSALQQGIQSITETTGQALESLLNSMRYYLATQQADVRLIRDTLLERLGTAISSVAQDSNNSPVLIELRLQTTILGEIRDTLSSCVKGGHKQGRNGIKVFMN